MKLTFLLENLTDISKENKLYHKSNLVALYSILKEKRLTGQKYTSTEEGRTELSTHRKNVILGKKLSSLSASAGCVNFILYKDRIKAGIKHAKINPVAEYTNDIILTTEKKLEKIYGKKMPLSLAQNIVKNFKYYIENPPSKVKEKMKEFGEIKNEQQIVVLMHELYFFSQEAKSTREGEERISLKNNSIPLNRKFVSIVITPYYKKDYELFISTELKINGLNKKDFIANLISMINKNSELFIKNKTYNDLLQFLKEKTKK